MQINSQDLEKTTDETRAKHAARWKNYREWPKIIEDMVHCSSFVMRDELTDLLSDGLVIIDKKGDLAPDLKRQWEAIIEEVKAVPKAETPAGIRQTSATLMECSQKMAHVMQLYSER